MSDRYDLLVHRRGDSNEWPYRNLPWHELINKLAEFDANDVDVIVIFPTVEEEENVNKT